MRTIPDILFCPRDSSKYIAKNSSNLVIRTGGIPPLGVATSRGSLWDKLRNFTSFIDLLSVNSLLANREKVV